MTKVGKTALEHFEDSVGGRGAIIESLELSTLDKKQQHLLNLLCDPKRANDTLNTIARDAGMKPLAIIELFRSAAFAKAHAIAISRMAAALPDVIDDIAEKSVDAKIECPTCFGLKKVEGVSCPTCYGKGQIMRFSDLDRQKILLESTGVTKKNQGVSVNVNQQVGIVNPGSFFSSFVKTSDAEAYAVDADVIDVAPEVTPDGK